MTRVCSSITSAIVLTLASGGGLNAAKKPKARDWKPATVVDVSTSSKYSGSSITGTRTTAHYDTSRFYTFDLGDIVVVGYQNLTPIEYGRIAIPRSPASIRSGSEVKIAIEKGAFYVVDDAGKEYRFAVVDYRKKEKVASKGPIPLPELTKRAEAGDSRAQFALGYRFSKGDGVIQDYTEALRWYRLAADQGNEPAINNLGHMFQFGKGIPQDYMEAEKWYRIAAEKGYGPAQNNLAWFYWLPKAGLPRDLILAHAWFNLAASKNTPDSASDRDKVAAEMTPEQLAEAHRIAREWKPKP